MEKISKWERVLNRKYQTQVQFINFWKQIWWAKSFIWQEVKVNFFTCKCVCQICRQISYCDERLNCCCTHKLFVALTLQKSKSVLPWTVFLSSDRQVVSQVKSLLVKIWIILTHVLSTAILDVLLNHFINDKIDSRFCFQNTVSWSGQLSFWRKAVQGVIFNNNGLGTILCSKIEYFRKILIPIFITWLASKMN